ncbi:uncharacterized protein LOC131033998 [Cryptomeria japonica]|uniref:uncharacterized protein LOC131033998 n=1 Tax=Cryptomeria japonica TaxID=3369 RepID=UPI0025AD65A3|nr:uncharacterized protein LOC131033998 [Cryptomeria japonica]
MGYYCNKLFGLGKKRKCITLDTLQAQKFDSKLFGHIVLKQGEGIHSCRAEIGYVIHHNYWNRGLATQAFESALKNGLSELKGVERVEGLVSPENVAYARVLEKAGFLNNGFFPKYVRVKGCVEDSFIFSYVAP